LTNVLNIHLKPIVIMLYKVSFLKVNTSTKCDFNTFLCVRVLCLCKFKRIPTRFKLLLKIQLTLMIAH